MNFALILIGMSLIINAPATDQAFDSADVLAAKVEDTKISIADKAVVEKAIVDQATLRSVRSEWAQPTMPFTREYEGRRLILIHTHQGLNEFTAWMKKARPDWIIEAAKDEKIIQGYDPARILPFIPDVVTYDEDGNEVSRVRPKAVPELNRYMGSPPWEARK